MFIVTLRPLQEILFIVLATSDVDEDHALGINGLNVKVAPFPPSPPPNAFIYSVAPT